MKGIAAKQWLSSLKTTSRSSTSAGLRDYTTKRTNNVEMTVSSLQEDRPPRTFTFPAAAGWTGDKLRAHVRTQQLLSLSNCPSVFLLSARPPLRCVSSLLLLDLQGWMMTAVCQPFDSSSSSRPPSPLLLLLPRFLPHRLRPSPCLDPYPCCSPAPTASQRSCFL